MINKNHNTEINEYHRMRYTLWQDHNEEELYNEMLQIIKGERFYKQELSWTVFVAVRENGKLGGFIEITIHTELEHCKSKPIAFIEGWYVDEDLRNNGVGAKLVDTAEKWAKENKCTEIASDVEFHNKVSHKAHEALGFTKYHTDDECIFYKKSI